MNTIWYEHKMLHETELLNKGCKVWKTHKSKQKSEQEKQKTKRHKTTAKTLKKHTQNKIRRRKERKKKEKEKKFSSQPTPFFWIIFHMYLIFHCLPVSSSKSLEPKPFALWKLCYLLTATFCKSNCFLWVI